MAERAHLLAQGSTEADNRVGLGALFVAGSDLRARPGVLSGGVVTQTATASGQVLVSAARVVNQAASATGGAFVEALDSTKTVDVFTGTTGMPPESSPRHDLIVYESGATTKVRVIKGTPAAAPTDPPIPAQATALARIRVKAASAYGGNEVITNADIDELRTYTALAGAPVPVASQAQRDALAKVPGLAVIRTDLGNLRQEWVTGSTWRTIAGVQVFDTPDTDFPRSVTVTNSANINSRLTVPEAPYDRTVVVDAMVYGGVSGSGLYDAALTVDSNAIGTRLVRRARFAAGASSSVQLHHRDSLPANTSRFYNTWAAYNSGAVGSVTTSGDPVYAYIRVTAYPA